MGLRANIIVSNLCVIYLTQPLYNIALSCCSGEGQVLRFVVVKREQVFSFVVVRRTGPVICYSSGDICSQLLWCKEQAL